MKKKALSIVLCTALAGTMLAACGGGGSAAQSTSSSGQSAAAASTSAEVAAETAEAAEAAETAEAVAETAEAAAVAYALDASFPEEPVIIGVEAYDTTDEQFLALQEYLDYLEEYYNVSFMYSESLASAEDELDFIDSVASAGGQGIIGYYNVAGAQAVQEAIDQGLYYWGTDSVYDQFADNDHYVGCYSFGDEAENGDYQGGYALAYNLGKQGVKHVFYCNGGAGMGIPMFVDRQTGFEAGIKAAQADGYDITYTPGEDTVEGWPGTDDFAASITAKLSSDYDGAAVAFNAAAIFQPIAEAGKSDSIKIATIGEVSDVYYDAVQSGQISVVVYDCEEVVFGCAVPVLLNAITGHGEATRNDEGKAGKEDVSRWVITDADTFNKIFEFHEAGNFYVTAEDMAQTLVGLNPDATFKTTYDLYKSYTLENAVK